MEGQILKSKVQNFFFKEISAESSNCPKCTIKGGKKTQVCMNLEYMKIGLLDIIQVSQLFLVVLTNAWAAQH